jgi:hypothetical protein
MNLVQHFLLQRLTIGMLPPSFGQLLQRIELLQPFLGPTTIFHLPSITLGVLVVVF